MNDQIKLKHQALANHPLYAALTDLHSVKIFMQFHVFAVWDFMSLLKSLQRKITCVELPWVDSSYDPELVRLINEIVLAEESDIDEEGKAMSHFGLYLKAMQEVGTDTSLIMNFVQQDFNLKLLPRPLREITRYHLDLAFHAEVHEVAASFFYGREKLIPAMFESIVGILAENNLDCPSLIYYLKRHIELDGDEHGPKAMLCLEGLTQTPEQAAAVEKVALQSLDKRTALWDFILAEIQYSRRAKVSNHLSQSQL